MRGPLLILIVAIAACGGPSKPKPDLDGHGPAGIDGPGIGDNLSKCGTLAKDALCACLADDEVSVCDLVDDGSTEAHVLRAGNEQQTDTYLVVDEGDGLRPVEELVYEQHHGKRDSDLSDPRPAVTTIGSTRVLRLEYDVSASTDYAQEQYDETLTGHAVVVCVLDGTPRCPIHTFTSCHTERTDFADPPNPANNGSGETTAHVEVDDAGVATVTKDSETGTPFDCAVIPQTEHLVR